MMTEVKSRICLNDISAMEVYRQSDDEIINTGTILLRENKLLVIKTINKYYLSYYDLSDDGTVNADGRVTVNADSNTINHYPVRYMTYLQLWISDIYLYHSRLYLNSMLNENENALVLVVGVPDYEKNNIINKLYNHKIYQLGLPYITKRKEGSVIISDWLLDKEDQTMVYIAHPNEDISAQINDIISLHSLFKENKVYVTDNIKAIPGNIIVSMAHESYNSCKHILTANILVIIQSHTK